jgi:hypothetical protein
MDRCTAEGDKPGKRKPDKHVVSRHGRVLSDVALAAVLGDAEAFALPEHPHPSLVIARQ